MMTRLAATILVLLPVLASAQDAGAVRRLFESGQFQQVVDSTPPEGAPDLLYTRAQSLQRLGAVDQAVQTYATLAALPESEAWHFIGVSGRQLAEGQTDAAIASAQQAAAMAPDNPTAHFQLGLALARAQQWPAAATEFEATATQQPDNAYAHYYAGMMQYRAKRVDLMGNHFNAFLKLAPNAPERPEVQSIMKTLSRR